MSGTRERRIAGDWRAWERWPSARLGREREILIWLPPGYAEGTGRRYPVLYLGDGRQVFDPGTSTWGKAWEVDDTGQRMVEAGEIEPFIAVAADCTEARDEEYAPTRRGKAYVEFLTEELKPAVDREFRTEAGRSYVAGASMGGLIAFYAGWTRPDVFRGAACLSPAFMGADGAMMTELVEAAGAAGKFPGTDFHLACGDKGELEQELLKGTLAMAKTLERAGYPKEKMSLRIEAGAEHNEEAWARVVPEFLRRFFGKGR